jgi:hypothetical protein
MGKNRRRTRLKIVYNTPAFARADGAKIDEPSISTQPPTDAEKLVEAIEKEYDTHIELYPWVNLDTVIKSVAEDYTLPFSEEFSSVAVDLLTANNEKNKPAPKAPATETKQTNWKKILLFAGIAFAVYYVFIRKGGKGSVSKIINIS